MKAARVANLILTVAAAILLFASVVGPQDGSARVLLALALASLALLLLPPAHKVNVVLLLVSLVLPLYAAELLLMPKTNTIRRRAEEAGRPFDSRSKAQVVADLRASGVRAFPAMHRGAGRLEFDDGAAVALGGISGVTSVMCNETGTWAVFESDEYGFNNPAGRWSSDSIRIAAIGDSYTMGWCVHTDSNMVGRLRARVPATLNLGIGGNGPLSELAALREYLPRVRPDVVLWVYYENDLGDLEEEKRDSLLLRYLDPSHRRNLPARQQAIDAQLSAFVEKAQPGAGGRGGEWRDHPAVRKLWQVAALTHVRQALHAVSGGRIGGAAVAGARQACCDVQLLARILALAESEVETWGGRLVFVFVPSRARYDRSPPVFESAAELEAREKVLSTVEALGIPIIDLHRAFSGLGAPERLYVFPGAHLDERGYRVASEAVLAGLEQVAPAR